jgi:hypothetical protein
MAVRVSADIPVYSCLPIERTQRRSRIKANRPDRRQLAFPVEALSRTVRSGEAFCHSASSSVCRVDDEKHVWDLLQCKQQHWTGTSDQVSSQDLRDRPTFDWLSAEAAVDSSISLLLPVEVSVVLQLVGSGFELTGDVTLVGDGRFAQVFPVAGL